MRRPMRLDQLLQRLDRSLIVTTGGAHPAEEGGGALFRVTARIFGERVLDDGMDRSPLPSRQSVREIPGARAPDGELGCSHAIIIAH